MPLVELGLVSRLDAQHPALTPRRHASSQRMLRCVAGFYGDPRHAQAVADALRLRFGLRDDQVDVIRADGLTRQALARAAQRWQCLRPRWGGLKQGLHLLGGALTGMVTGGVAAVLGWLLIGGAGDTAADAWAWLLPGLWAGALSGATTALAMSWRQPRHRFDLTVARRLRRGYSAVVAHGLGELQEAGVLAHLQDTSHSWCAEAPRRDPRL